MSKLENDIDWHLAQIERLQAAIAMGEPAKNVAAKTPIWGPKASAGGEMPDTVAGMRKLLERYEQTLLELEEQRGRGD